MSRLHPTWNSSEQTKQWLARSESSSASFTPVLRGETTQWESGQKKHQFQIWILKGLNGVQESDFSYSDGGGGVMGGCSTAEGLTGKSDQLQGRLAIKGFSSESTHSQNRDAAESIRGACSFLCNCVYSFIKGWRVTRSVGVDTHCRNFPPHRVSACGLLASMFWLWCLPTGAFSQLSSTRPTSRRGFSNNKAIISNKYLDWWWRHSRQCEH